MAYPANITPLHIDTLSRYSVGQPSRLVNVSAAPVATAWVQNIACFVPFSIPFPYALRRFWLFNGSTITSSSVDIGIYTIGGRRLASTGVIAQSGASAIQYAAPSAGALLLSPGDYYLAVVNNNATGTARMQALAGTAIAGRSLGLLQMAAASPLPATATYAAWAQAFSVPFFGITRTASGY